MQITVEIEVSPAELRDFLGLPDLSGYQEELLSYVKDKVQGGANTLDEAAGFVKDNLKTGLDVWGKLVSFAVGPNTPPPLHPLILKPSLPKRKALL